MCGGNDWARTRTQKLGLGDIAQQKAHQHPLPVCTERRQTILKKCTQAMAPPPETVRIPEYRNSLREARARLRVRLRASTTLK